MCACVCVCVFVCRGGGGGGGGHASIFQFLTRGCLCLTMLGSQPEAPRTATMGRWSMTGPRVLQQALGITWQHRVVSCHTHPDQHYSVFVQTKFAALARLELEGCGSTSVTPFCMPKYLQQDGLGFTGIAMCRINKGIINHSI